MKISKLLIAILLVVSTTSSYAQRKIINIPPPYGFTKCESDAYGTYLRNLPLKPTGSLVKLHNGSVKGYQDGAHAMIRYTSTSLMVCGSIIVSGHRDTESK